MKKSMKRKYKIFNKIYSTIAIMILKFNYLPGSFNSIQFNKITNSNY